MRNASTGPTPRLKRRKDFLRIARDGRKAVTQGLVLQARPLDAEEQSSGEPQAAPRVGFTASRKVGGAVERNRARRRLKAVVQDVMTECASTDYEYVVIARAGTLTRSYDGLIADLKRALAKVGAQKEAS